MLDELLVALGYDYDPEALSQFTNDIERTTNLVKRMIQVVGAGAAAITGLVVATTAASDEQGKLADEINETVENISALEFAQRRSGGSTEELSSSLRGLAKTSSEAARGTGEGLKAFGLLGISVTDVQGRLKPVSDLILEVSQRFQGLSRSRQIELAEKLGLSGSIRLLQQGPEAIRELTQEARALGVTTEQDAAISAQFQDSLIDLWTIFKQVSRTLTRSLAPVLQEVAAQLTEWWKVNRQVIESKMPEWIESVTNALKLFSAAVAWFLSFRLAMHLVQLITLMRGLSAATLLTNAAALLLPALIFAAITAVALLAEDAKVFFEGGESFIGDMLEKFPQWSDQIISIAAAFGTLADLTVMIFDGWSNIFELFEKFSLENFKETIKSIPGFIGDITGAYTVEDRLNDQVEGVSGVERFFRSIGGGITDLFMNSNSAQLAQDFYGGFLERDVVNNTNNTSKVNRIDRLEINVNGAQDPEATGNSVFNIFQQAAQDLDSAVDQ